MKTTILILAILAFCYGSFRAGQHYARPVAVPLPVLATPPPDALGTLEWRAPMPPQHTKEPLRVSL